MGSETCGMSPIPANITYPGMSAAGCRAAKLRWENRCSYIIKQMIPNAMELNYENLNKRLPKNMTEIVAEMDFFLLIIFRLNRNSGLGFLVTIFFFAIWAYPICRYVQNVSYIQQEMIHNICSYC